MFMFTIYGFYYVNRSMRWEKNDNWYRMQYMLNHAIENGFDSVASLPEDYRKG